MKLKGIGYVVLSAVMFGLIPLITVYVYDYDLSAISISFYRCLFAVPFLYGLSKLRHCFTVPCKQDLLKVLLVATFGSFATILLLNISYQYISIGLATSIHFMYPLFVILFCALFFHESISRGQIVSLVLCLIGVGLIVQLDSQIGVYGLLFALASSLTYAFYLVAIEKLQLLKKYESCLVSMYICCFASLGYLILGTFTGGIDIVYDVRPYLLLILVAFGAQVVAIVSLQTGIKYLGSSVASLFSVLEPVVSLISGYFFLNDPLTLTNVIGCLFILFGVILLTIANRKETSTND